MPQVFHQTLWVGGTGEQGEGQEVVWPRREMRGRARKGSALFRLGIRARARRLSNAEGSRESEARTTSMFLLEQCGLAGKRVRSNKQGDTISLSFRNIARLLIVTETEITELRSPLSGDIPTSNTANFATFKLLLPGIDDSALVKTKTNGARDPSRTAQLELLDQLLDEYRQRISALTDAPEELEDQLKRLEVSIEQQAASLASTEVDYRHLVDQRRDFRKRLEEGRDRRSEIDAFLERFTLLERHYVSTSRGYAVSRKVGHYSKCLGRPHARFAARSLPTIARTEIATAT